MLTWPEYVAAWSGLHGGYDPSTGSRFVRGWLLLSYRLARTLFRLRVTPDAVTLSGLLWAAGVPLLALLGPPGALGAVALIAVAAVADSVDGALAVLGRRTTGFGYVLDSVVDRLAEAAWLTGLWFLGGPGWLAACGGAACWSHEYVRARASSAGMAGLGVITVSERPTRVIVALVGFAATGAVGQNLAGSAATVSLGVWLALSAVGLVQLIVAVRRALR